MKIHAEGSGIHFFSEPLGSVEVRDGTGYDQKQAWDVAVRFQDIKRYAHVTDLQKRHLQTRAVQGVLERARGLVGRVSGAEDPAYLTENELQERGARGDLDIEESVVQGAPIFDARVEKERPVALIMDVSMSMKGDKLAHLALAVSAIALSVSAPRLAILGFDSRVRWVKKFSEVFSEASLVEKVLNLPAGGFTHMELALVEMQAELERARREQAHVVLIGDGKYTEGKDPLPCVDFFRRFHVLKIGRDIGGRKLLQEMAERGGTSLIEARSYADLPKTLYALVRSLQR